MTLDIISFVLIITIAQAVFLLIGLSLKTNKSSPSTLFFGLLLIFFIWFQLEFLSVRTNHIIKVDLLYITRYGGWYAVGPLLYFYAKSYLLRKKFTWSWHNLVHFAPFILFALTIPALTDYMVLTWRSRGYGMLTVFDDFETGSNAIQMVYGGLFVGQFIHALLYTILGLKFVTEHEKVMKSQLSNIHRKATGWLKVFFILQIIVLVLVLVFLYILFISNSYKRDMDYLFVIPITLLIYGFSYRAMNSTGLLFLPISDEPKKKYRKSTLSPALAKAKIGELVAYVEEQKPYLDPDLRLAQLASQTEISPHHLSQLINEHLETSFYDFINAYRVKEAKKLIEKQPNYTLLAIALECGFNNKSSFGNAFKKHLGMTPLKFRQSFQEEHVSP